MAKAPAFQFYAKDWLSSSRVIMMTPEQEGAYLRLLCYCWDSGDCSLPDDDDALAKLSRIGPRWHKGIGTAVRACFNDHPSKPGFITNQRMLLDFIKSEEWREKSSAAGKLSAKLRSSKIQPTLNGGSELVEPNSNSSLAPAPALKSPLPPATGGGEFASAIEVEEAVARITGIDPQTCPRKFSPVIGRLTASSPPYTAAEVLDFGKRWHSLCPAQARKRDRPYLGDVGTYIGRVRADKPREKPAAYKPEAAAEPSKPFEEIIVEWPTEKIEEAIVRIRRGDGFKSQLPILEAELARRPKPDTS